MIHSDTYTLTVVVSFCGPLDTWDWYPSQASWGSCNACVTQPDVLDQAGRVVAWSLEYVGVIGSYFTNHETVILGCPWEIPAQNGARYAPKTTQTTTILTICTKMFADMCVHDVIHHQSIEALFGLLEHTWQECHAWYFRNVHLVDFSCTIMLLMQHGWVASWSPWIRHRVQNSFKAKMQITSSSSLGQVLLVGAANHTVQSSTTSINW